MCWKIRYLLFLSLLGAIIFETACSQEGRRASDVGLTAPSTVRIATSKNLWCTLTLIADAKGFFLEERLTPNLSYQAAGRLNMDALLGGAADFANVVETNIAYQALNRTSGLVILGRIVAATDYAILTKVDAGIQAPGDLRGKRLAYAQATGAESFLFWFLENERIPAKSLRLVPLQPAGVVDHFIGGQTEAVATWEPFVTTIRNRMGKLGPAFQANPLGFEGIMTVATTSNYGLTHPDVLQRYDRVMEKAYRFVADRPAEAQQIMADRAGLPLETVRSIWSRFNFNYKPASPADASVVVNVVRRIRENVPEMAAREPADIKSYFVSIR